MTNIQENGGRRELNLLHLSDLHYLKSGYDQSIVLDALYEDLRLVCRGASRPDAIFFSGDLSQAGDLENTYYSIYENFFETLASITGCSEQRMFLCPGNHDAQRSVIEGKLELQKDLLDSMSNRTALNERYLNGDITEFAKSKFAEFRTIAEFFGAERVALDDGVVRVEHVTELALDIVTINSAWLTSGGLKGLPRDEKRLLVPEAALLKAKSLLKPEAMHILVMHHPIDWFPDWARSDFEQATDGMFQLHLFGHMHDVEPKNIITAKGSCFHNQAGALYQGRERYNGYSLISLDPTRKLFRLRARSYFTKTRQFDDGVDVIPNGLFCSSEESKSFWRARAQIVDPKILAEWMKDSLLPAALRIYNVSITDRPMEEVFVSPPMIRRTTIRDDKAGVSEREDKPITLSEIVEGSSNFVIYGRQDYGKTTILQQLSIEIIKRSSGSGELPMVPIILDYKTIKKGARPISRVLKSSILSELPGMDFDNLLENGFVAVLVDDVEFSDETRWALLKGFMKEHPRVRYFFSSNPTSSDGLMAALSEDLVIDPGTPLHFDHIFLDVFNRAKLRHLVKLWDKEGELDQEAMVNRLVKELTGMNIPITAVNGTILLTIYQQKAAFRPINRSVLIEQFVEHALEKRAPQQIFRGALDYKNKEFLLAELAATMAAEDEYILPWQRIVDILGKSLSAIGLRYDVEAIVRYFVHVGILRHRADGYVSFRYRAFLEYFIACKMRDSEEFRGWILSEERYLQFLNEILYYAGLVRHAEELLVMIGDRFDVLNDEAAKDSSWNSDLDQLDGFKPPHDEGEEDIFDDFAKQMQLPAYTEAERDEVLDAEILRDVEERQEVFRPGLGTLGHKWTIALLLYSGVLKNLELIPDRLKRIHLRKALRAWGSLTAISLTLVPQIARGRGARINGVDYEVRLPKSYSEHKVARIIYLDMPRSISHMMYGIIGTEKLERQLVEPELVDATEPLITHYYRNTLIGLLRLEGWLSALRKLEEAVQEKSNYLSEALLRSLADMYFLGGHSKDDEKTLVGLIGNAAGKLRGRGKTVGTERSHAIQYVNKRLLLRRLQAKAQDEKE